MPLREITVHVPTLAGWPPHADYAARLAARWGARLQGLHVIERTAIDGLQDPPVAPERRRRLQAAREAEPGFRSFSLGLGASQVTWCVGEGQLPRCLALAASGSDLVVLGCHRGTERSRFQDLDRSVVEARLPCLLVPDDAAATTPKYTRVVVAWNGSPESWRALRSSEILLERASSVLVLDGSRQRDASDGELWPPPTAIDWLAQRRIHAERVPLESEDSGAGIAVLSAATDFRADLLVMGAYGRSRFSEWLLGGATAQVLRQAALPVLMQH